MARREQDPAQVPIGKYLEAHSRPNGGFKSFFHSNLFSALVIFLLGQAILVGFAISSSYNRTTQLMEWKGEMVSTIKAMNENGTQHEKALEHEQDKDIARLEALVIKMQKDTEHFDVMEIEHQRLTKDVENLKNGKK